VFVCDASELIYTSMLSSNIPKDLNNELLDVTVLSVEGFVVF
jgi:hypothetical protein